MAGQHATAHRVHNKGEVEHFVFFAKKFAKSQNNIFVSSFEFHYIKKILVERKTFNQMKFSEQKFRFQSLTTER
jgi:hypothetical protein